MIKFIEHLLKEYFWGLTFKKVNQAITFLLESYFWALVVKEINQTLKNKQLIILLLFIPTIYLLVIGFTLNPNVHNLKLGIIDYNNTPYSRELVTAFTNNGIFTAERYNFTQRLLNQQIQEGQVNVGLVIPPAFNRNLHQDHKAEIQILIDGVNANTARIAKSYISQIVRHYSRQLTQKQKPQLIEPQIIFLYNPGLINSWFSVPAALGLAITLTSSLTSANSVITEKSTGKIQQLLMTPVTSQEILLAKVLPLFVILLGDVTLALSISRLFFSVPLPNNFILFLGLSGLYIFVGTGMGFLLATVSGSQLQALLTSFFVNIPLILLSGALAPIESMPPLLQYLSLLNPVRHYVEISRDLLLKDVGLNVLWPKAVVLGIYAIALFIISIKKYRQQALSNSVG